MANYQYDQPTLTYGQSDIEYNGYVDDFGLLVVDNITIIEDFAGAIAVASQLVNVLDAVAIAEYIDLVPGYALEVYDEIVIQ